MDNLGITNFQIKLSDILIDIFSNFGWSICFEEKGGRERYLQARWEIEDIDIWIYEDEAELRHHGRQFFCERQAYLSENELISEFTGEVRNILHESALKSRIEPRTPGI